MKDDSVDPIESSPPADSSMRGSLLMRLRENDGDSWRQFWDLYDPVVRQWCARSGLAAHDAADVAQEVFRSVAASLGKFRRDRPRDTFRGWLWTITRNKIRDHWRARKEIPDAFGGTDAQRRLADLPEELSGEWSTAAGVGTGDGLFRRALEQIRAGFEERTWQAFWRTAVEDQTAAEVAAALGMSPGAVYVAKSRVLARLREELGDVLE